jgi:rare lipoprotein A
MRFTTQRRSTQFRCFLAASAIALSVTGPAYAGQRNPAPIIYAGQSATAPQGRAPSVGSPQRISAPAPGEEGKRIVFRYPGQGSAMAPSARRNYASASVPQMSAPSSAATQMMTPNGFDAETAAARIAANRQAAPIESEALASLEPLEPSDAPRFTSAIQASAVPASTIVVSPDSGPVFDETGVGVTYGDEFAGLPTANGEVFNQDGLTAAHPTLPLPSLIQVINVDTQKEVVVRVNDRGPFEDGASLQLSRRAASALAFGSDGRANIRVRYLGAAPVSGRTVALSPSAAPERLVPATYTVGTDQNRALPVQYASANFSDTVQFGRSEQTGQGSYFVQVGSFSDIGNAQTFQKSLGSDLSVTIMPARVNGTDYFRVRVGPFDDRHSAAEMRDNLAFRGVANGRVVSAD